MSRTWAKGSTPQWRRTRTAVINRDSGQCQLRHPGCTAPNIGDLYTQTAHVHHLHGRAVTGDDPAHLVATCQHCNLSTGDPTRKPDPAPTPNTRW